MKIILNKLEICLDIRNTTIIIRKKTVKNQKTKVFSVKNQILIPHDFRYNFPSFAV